MTESTDLTEKAWQAQVIQVATTLGWKHYFTYRSRRSPSGYPDLTLVRDRVVWAELKSAAGKPTADQRAWLGALEAAGAEVYLWKPSDLEEVGRVLSRRETKAEQWGALPLGEVA